jgi:hypothetical protein
MRAIKIPKSLSLFLSLLILASCQAKKGGGTSTPSEAPSASSTPAGPTGDPTTIAALPTALGVRNFDQVNASMESVTGVMGNGNVIARFNLLKAQLPSTNDIKAFSFSGQGAVTVLAAEYCTALVTNTNNMYATQLAAAIGTFNMAAIPTVAFTTATSAALAQSLIIKFWGSGYASNANAMAAQQTVEQLITGLITGQANTTTTTRNAVIGACTSVLASAPTSIY